MPCAFCIQTEVNAALRVSARQNDHIIRKSAAVSGGKYWMKRCYSLKRNKSFRRVYRVGKSNACASLVLIYARSRRKELHVGFSVSKKLGNSVLRNRVKRRLRESFTPLIPFVKTGYDMIYIAREPVVQEEFSAIGKDMRRLLRKCGLLIEADASAGTP